MKVNGNRKTRGDERRGQGCDDVLGGKECSVGGKQLRLFTRAEVGRAEMFSFAHSIDEMLNCSISTWQLLSWWSLFKELTKFIVRNGFDEYSLRNTYSTGTCKYTARNNYISGNIGYSLCYNNSRSHPINYSVCYQNGNCSGYDSERS